MSAVATTFFQFGGTRWQVELVVGNQDLLGLNLEEVCQRLDGQAAAIHKGGGIQEVQVEAYGGDVLSADISAKTGDGIDDLLDKAISAATTFGSGQKQIEGQNEFVQNLVDSMTSGIGSMVDADIEAASAKLQALQVQQQLGVQALSIANSAPQTLLSLFR